MQFSLSRERNAIEQLVARARAEFEALGFIPFGTTAKLSTYGYDVSTLEDRFAFMGRM